MFNVLQNIFSLNIVKKLKEADLIFVYFSGYCDGQLLVFSDTHVDVFNAASGEWLQTLSLKRARPLNSTGTLSVCIMNDMPHIIYLSNIHQREYWSLANQQSWNQIKVVFTRKKKI